MVGAFWLLLATSTGAPPDCAAPPPVVVVDDAEDDEPQLGFQLRFGYEATWLRMSRVGFDGQISGFREDPEAYTSDAVRPDLVVHGMALRPNLIYQPGNSRLQLTVGLHIGFGLGSVGAYAGTTADGLSVVPNPDRPAVAIRAGLPVGVRLDLGGPALRATLVPGVGLIAVDELIANAGSQRDGSATAVSELVRGEFGLEVPVAGAFGLTFDGGYDFGLAGGWFLGGGLALTFDPEAATPPTSRPSVPLALPR